MASRYTETGKWRDSWFRSLDVKSKLVWLWLCDNCDICGYMEWCVDVASADLKLEEEEIDEIVKGFGRKVMWSDDGGSLLIPNFLRHQKNLPLLASPVHKGIAKRWYGISHKFSNYFLDSKLGIVKGIDTLSIPYPNPIDTLSIPLPKDKDTLKVGYRYPTGNSNSNSNGNRKRGVGKNQNDSPFSISELTSGLLQAGVTGQVQEIWDYWKGMGWQYKGDDIDLQFVIDHAVQTIGVDNPPAQEGEF